MLFNSFEFILFFVVVYLLYCVSTHRLQNFLLLIASYVFYASWDWRFLSLILISTIVDFICGQKIHQATDLKHKRFFLFLSVFCNLSILGFFKYCNFFVDSFASLLSLFGANPNFPSLSIILPVGISFYTFQTMSYTIDIYRRKMKPTDRFFDFALFVAFFPQLVAGPIERARNLLPQISSPRTMTSDQRRRGMWLIIFGLFKKVIIADNLAIVVDSVFSASPTPSGITCLLGIYCFAFQIYCDFSGYSDIAKGVAEMMGITIMKNFNLPYLATNPREFWQRWHISLSTWLRDYLYIPLGGNQHGQLNTLRNLMITMLLGGLWHGAAWTFVIWGFYHGLLLVLHRVVTVVVPKQQNNRSFIILWLKRIAFFHFVCLGWLIFRANHMEQVGSFLNALFFNFAFDFRSPQLLFYTFCFIPLLHLFESQFKNSDDPRLWKGWPLAGPVVVTIMIMSFILLSPPKGVAFIYFQF